MKLSFVKSKLSTKAQVVEAPPVQTKEVKKPTRRVARSSFGDIPLGPTKQEQREQLVQNIYRGLDKK